MENKKTYTQEELNVACKSYNDEARKLMDVKAALMIELYNCKEKIMELTKHIAENKIMKVS